MSVLFSDKPSDVESGIDASETLTFTSLVGSPKSATSLTENKSRTIETGKSIQLMLLGDYIAH